MKSGNKSNQKHCNITAASINVTDTMFTIAIVDSMVELCSVSKGKDKIWKKFHESDCERKNRIIIKC